MYGAAGLRLVARWGTTACALPALLASSAYGASTPAASSPTLSCVSVTGQDPNGKVLVAIPGTMVGTTKEGAIILAVDPTCLAAIVDPYADAHATIDTVVEKAKEAGLPPTLVDQAGTDLNKNVDTAKKTGDSPANQVNGANDARVQKSKDSGSQDDATVAAIAAVAGVCMVASAGICTAAIAAILPSILPAKVTTQDVQGVARVLNDLNQGKPVSPEDMKSVIDVIQKVGTATKSDLDVIVKLGETGLKVVAQTELEDAGLKSDVAAKVVALINQAVTSGGSFDCDATFHAAGISGPVQIKDKKLVSRILAAVQNTKYGAAISPSIQVCLTKYLDTSE